MVLCTPDSPKNTCIHVCNVHHLEGLYCNLILIQKVYACIDSRTNDACIDSRTNDACSIIAICMYW